MPALYRMPIVYLCALVIAAALGLRTWGRQSPPAVESTAQATIPGANPPATDRSDPAPIAAAAAPAQPPAPAPEANDDGILRTADGLRRKVVVKDLGITCRDAPAGGAAIGPPLDYFAIRYVRADPPAGGPPMIQVGSRTGPPEGWLPQGAVFEWNTRLMARPTARAGRPPLVIFREESCLLDALAQRACAKHPMGCPTEGEEAAGSAAAEPTSLGLPILQARAIPQPDGSTRTIFEVASLVSDRAPTPRPAEPPADLRPFLKAIDIAFVVDTTASMQSAIDATKQLAQTLVADANRRYADLSMRLALVEYRDESPLFGFKRRIVCDFADAATFRAALDRVVAAKSGDGSVDEAVCDGLDLALPPVAGLAPGAPHLDWPAGRRGELATKMLVLVGDAPDHARDLERVAQIAARAKQAGITLAAVTIDRPGALSRDEQARYRAQWHALAAGSFRPLDKGQGFAQPVEPVEITLDQAAHLAPRIQAAIDDRIEHARDLAALAVAEAEGKLAEYTNSQGLSMRQILPVLDDLHKGERVPQPRLDPRFNGQKAPSVRRGWIAGRLGSSALVEIHVLMTKAELEAVIDELTQLQQAASGSARDLGELLRIGTAAASGETSFLAADRGDLTFADHLRRRQGLPPARPNSLLRRSQADLLQADDAARAALDARLRTSIPRLIKRRNDPDWDDPARTIDGLALVPYDAIDW